MVRPAFCSCQNAWESRSRGAQLHVFRLGRPHRCFGTEAVVLEVAASVLVEQDAALAAAGFGDQDPRAGKARGVVLDELHVAQGYSGEVRHRHAVAGHDRPVGVLGERPGGTARRDDHRRGLQQDGIAVALVVGDHATDPSLRPGLVDHQVEGEVLVETGNRLELQRCLEQGVQHVEAGLVRGEPRAGAAHASEAADVDVALRGAAPRATPPFELVHLGGGVLHEVLDGVLVAQPVAAGDGVVEVRLRRVLRVDDARGPALGGHRVRPHRVDLRDQCDRHGWTERATSIAALSPAPPPPTMTTSNRCANMSQRPASVTAGLPPVGSCGRPPSAARQSVVRFGSTTSRSTRITLAIIPSTGLVGKVLDTAIESAGTVILADAAISTPHLISA